MEFILFDLDYELIDNPILEINKKNKEKIKKEKKKMNYIAYCEKKDILDRIPKKVPILNLYGIDNKDKKTVNVEIHGVI